VDVVFCRVLQGSAGYKTGHGDREEREDREERRTGRRGGQGERSGNDVRWNHGCAKGLDGTFPGDVFFHVCTEGRPR
jgi:hypothetical protein